MVWLLRNVSQKPPGSKHLVNVNNLQRSRWKATKNVVISCSYHNNSYSFGYTRRALQSSSSFYLSYLGACFRTYINPSHSVYYLKALHFDAIYSGMVQHLAGIYYRAGLVSLFLLASTVRENVHTCWEEGWSLVTQITLVLVLGYSLRLVSLTHVDSYQISPFPWTNGVGNFSIIYFDVIVKPNGLFDLSGTLVLVPHHLTPTVVTHDHIPWIKQTSTQLHRHDP